MNLVQLRGLVALSVLGSAGPLFAASAPPTETANDDDLVSLAAYNVKADRIENFGFRVSDAAIVFVAVVPVSQAPFVDAVLPNSAAAKAGLQPGDRILKTDGRSAAMGLFSADKWRKLMAAKAAEAATGRTVKWTLEIQPRGTKETRTVTLTLPTPPPRWGASVWHAPEDRPPSAVAEAGPLAERSRIILDNGIWVAVDRQFLSEEARAAGFAANSYEWHFSEASRADGYHQMTVTQVGRRTEVLLEMASRFTGRWVYRTSPSGALEKAWHFTRKQKGEVPPEEAREGFAHELDLWANQARKLSPRWPLELTPGYDANAIFAALAAKDGAAKPATPARTFAKEFLQLPVATATQRALFADAYGKLGAEPDRWAYTETARGLGDKRVLVTRVDPSKPEAERCVLLSVDGRPPKPADVQRWRDDGGDVPKTLGDLPPLASIVELKDLRVQAEDAASVLFELPIRSERAGDFPAEKFQALFRVNKTQRAFEEITIRLRDSLRVAGVVKVTEAGLQARFQTLDPAAPPQPVLLKGGGAARVLFVKLARDFEATRADFTRVTPYDEPEK